MSASVATGLDGISSKILKLSKNVIAPSLAHIINKSFSLGVVPEVWREARVTPVHKAGDVSNISNYTKIWVLSYHSWELQPI